jgi:tRNA nucleotidyltransferase/poly(A) polymerase
VLRTVGDPAIRFSEDRLRVLRALRFAGRFDLRIEAETWDALVASTDKLDNLSPERVREELYKLLAGQERPSTSLGLYQSSGVLAALYPELQACVGVPDGESSDVWSHQLATVDTVSRTRPILRLAALLHHVGKPVVARGGEELVDGISPHGAAGAAIVWQLMQRLRASNADANRVAHIVAQHAPLPHSDAPPAELRRWLRRVGSEFYRDVLRLRLAMSEAEGDADSSELHQLIRRVRAVLRDRPPLVISDLAIGGAELRALGIPSGPLYGEILRDLLDRVTDDPSLNSRERLMEVVEREMADGGARS